MNENETPAEPAELPAPLQAPPSLDKPVPVAKPARGGSVWPVLSILGFLILAAGEGYLWHLDQAKPDASGQIAALQTQLAALQQSAAAPANAAAGAGAPETDQGAHIAALTSELDALQTLVTTDHNAVSSLQQGEIDDAKLAAAVATMQVQGGADHAALAALQANTANLTKLTGKITVLSRLETARMALDAGQSLGPIPNAPPELARFAETPPPTEAALILSFPAAARRAESASVTSDGKRSAWSGVVARVEGIVTISNGTHVLVGAPAAAVIEQARASLAAGDLPGAVAVLNTLSVSTQAAMGDWLTQARALVAARGAIARMAGQA
jgi:hypothetical protein